MIAVSTETWIIITGCRPIGWSTYGLLPPFTTIPEFFVSRTP